MSPSQLANEINRFVANSWTARIVRDSNFTVLRGLGGELFSVSWAGASALIDRQGPSLQEYVELLKRKQYTILLSDYSFLQFAFLCERESVVKHRLVYYPCPLDIEEDVDDDLPILDLIEMLSERDVIERLRQRSPLRFEFDPVAATEEHSASHLHLWRDSCRIPVYAPLGPARFVRRSSNTFILNIGGITSF